MIGIVKRVDDLGRIAIPKEIRKIYKIRDGEPMEVFVLEEGILIKKYSPLAKLNDFAQEYAYSIFESTGHTTIITDRNIIIAVAGGLKREYLEKNIGNTVLEAMENHIVQLNNDEIETEIREGIIEKSSSYVIAPIILYGDPAGSVMLFNHSEDIKMGDTEIKVAETAARFLARQIEE